MSPLVRQLPPSLVRLSPDPPSKQSAVQVVWLRQARRRQGPSQALVSQRWLCLEHVGWGRRARLQKGDPVCFTPAPGPSPTNAGKEAGGQESGGEESSRGRCLGQEGACRGHSSETGLTSHPKFERAPPPSSQGVTLMPWVGPPDQVLRAGPREWSQYPCQRDPGELMCPFPRVRHSENLAFCKLREGSHQSPPMLTL